MDIPPLRLLSLDGGGVKGLTSLLILQQIFLAVENKLGHAVQPYEYFDLIGGTSTGGLIAIMLGRLRMTIEEAIAAYKELSPKIFEKKWWTQSQTMKYFGAEMQRYWFEGKNLEYAIQMLLTKRNLDPKLKLWESDDPSCRVFVCAVSAFSTHVELLRSYKSRKVGHPNYDCFLWEAARATSAAPLFFEPITLESSNATFVDGGIRANNPIDQLSSEAERLWPDREIGCLISIGTGVTSTKAFDPTKSKLHEVLKSLSDIATDADVKARIYRDTKEGRKLQRNKKYFRYSVPHGMDSVDLTEFEKFPWMESMIIPYTVDMDDNIEECAENLVHSKSAFDKREVLKPSSTIPFGRDKYFVGREDTIQDIDLKFATHRRVALVGLGGIGKSQIAIEYSYRFAKKFPDSWIFWVHSSSEERFNKSYQEIADKVQLSGRRNPKANINRLVSEWLTSELSGCWLMILDNADNVDLFFLRTSSSPQGQSTIQRDTTLLSYIPQTANGSVLITSRDREAAFGLTNEAESLIYIDKMPKEDSKKLLQTKLPGVQSDDNAERLVEALEYLPLAITQASAYIIANSPRMTISRYLNLFQQSESNQASLMNKGFPDLRRDPAVPNSVITTWEISFRQIELDNLRAAELLSFMSFLDRQGIPVPLLRKFIVDDLEFEDALGRLNAFSFITAEKGCESYEIHRLVQLATRKWLSLIGDSDRWSAKALSKLLEVFPNGYFENWETCATYLPHAKAVLQHGQVTLQDLILRGELLSRIALYLHSHGKYGAAEEMYLQVLKIREQELGEHPETLTSMNNLALAYQNQGRWDQAEVLQIQVLNTRKRVLGEEHPDTLTSMNNLASTYWSQGRWEQAEVLQVQVLNTRKRVLGEEHPDTLTSMGNLALTYLDRGLWDQAEVLQVQVLNTHRRVLGEEHPHTLTSMGNLALTYLDQGRWDQAEVLQVQALNTCKRVLGEEHPDTITSMNNLTLTYRNQGRWDQAEVLQIRALNTRKRVLGEEHLDTLTSMGTLALTYLNQGRWEQAEALQVQVLNTRKRVLGEEHPNTFTSMEDLASTYLNQGRWDQAEVLQVQVLNTRKRVFGEEHPGTLTSMENLALTYLNQGRWDQAEVLQVKALDTHKRVLGEEHPDTLTSMGNLASTYWNRGQWEQAEVLQVRVLDTHKRVLGEEHPDTLTSMGNLASTYWDQGRWEQAEALQVQVLNTCKRVLGEEHPNTLKSMNNLALTYRNQGRWDQAEVLQVQVLNIRKRVLGGEHPDTLTSMGNLASTYLIQGRWDQAEALAVQVMGTHKRVLGEEHPDMLASMNNLAFILYGQRKYEAAKEMFRRALDGCKKAMGENHPHTLACSKSYFSLLDEMKQQSPNIEEERSENAVDEASA